MKQKIISIVISICLLWGIIAPNFSDAAFAASKSTAETYSTAIVTLSEPSLLDYLNQNKKYHSIGELIISEEGQRLTQTILDQQATVMQQLQLNPHVDISESRSFTALTNAFTVRVPLSELDTIRHLKGVASVKVSAEQPASLSTIETKTNDIGNTKNYQPYETRKSTDPDTSAEQESSDESESSEASKQESSESESSETSEQETSESESSETSEQESSESESSEASEQESSESDKEESSKEESFDDTKESSSHEKEPYGMASKGNVNVNEAYKAGYTGKGTLIAILDNEFDVRHEVFRTKPDIISYDKEYVRSIASNGRLGISAKYHINDIFYNGKVIYAYDYGDNDNDCRSNEVVHGTHVAGIAAGNNLKHGEYPYLGMAYDAQLAFFKISDKNNYLKDEYIIAALDDAIKLSPDVINCSYGAVQYLTHDYEGRQLYEKVLISGIAIIAAAGNDAYNGYDSGAEKIPTSYASYGTVCTPSSMDQVLSVASSVPDYTYSHEISFEFNEVHPVSTQIVHSNLNFEDLYGDDQIQDNSSRKQILSDEDYTVLDRVAYEYLQGKGTSEDFKNAGISRKLVILNESELSVDEIVRNSLEYKCYAVVLIRKEQNSSLKPDLLEKDFFVYTVDAREKEYFESHPKGEVSFLSANSLSKKEQDQAKTISVYSSYGPRADLHLKPDITAPGENILSSLTDQSFGLMSGTSMATPCVTGAYAIMKQFIKETHPEDIALMPNTTEHIYQHLMSTASLLSYDTEDGDTVYFSPRAQGAGCINLESAIKTGAYLSYQHARPSVSLLDREDGQYDFTFEIINETDHSLTYSLETILQTDGYEVNEKPKAVHPYWNKGIPESILDHATIIFKDNNLETDTITVGAGKEKSVSVVIRLEPGWITERRNIFTNGFFVDGFVCLKTEADVELHLPFSGFCGDWSQGAIFPSNAYPENDEFPIMNSRQLSIVSSFNFDNTLSETAGTNLFGYQDLPMVIAFGKNSLRSYYQIAEEINTAPSLLLPNIFVLRDTKDYTISMENEQGLMLFQNFGDIPANMNPSIQQKEYFISPQNSNTLDQCYLFVESAKEGKYTYTVSASTVDTKGNPDRKENVSFQVYIDNTSPIIHEIYLQKTKGGKLYLNIEASDNLFLQGIQLYAVKLNDHKEIESKLEMYDELVQYLGSEKKLVSYHYDDKVERYYFRFDFTDYQGFLKQKTAEQTQIYQNDDVTIIFESDKNFTLMQNDAIAIRAVDCAYLCSEDQVIHLNAYGEATLKLRDANNNPLPEVHIWVDGQIHQSDHNGNIYLKNLSLGKHQIIILSDYELLDGNNSFTFRLSRNDYQYSTTAKLAKIPEPTNTTETKTRSNTDTNTKPQSHQIIRFNTSESNNQLTICYYGMILSSTVIILIILCQKKKRHYH